ncbi:MAG: UDP-N-acetylmuramoyl-tripeptide--D-alanyl-D-alanine ligase [Gammaproteobacteria bacterium]|nr:UDP-N-acetylmuramoyl-tripeptide--D-alanyl-D-alanine ligase [Gammaproteobacteria bacterium]
MNGCQLSLSHVAPNINAQLVGADCNFVGVTTDTRAVLPGQLFVALKGPNFDAHDFVEEALQAGAVALLVERQLDIALPQLVVSDALIALGKLAAYWRSLLTIPFVAVTGSNGKTTVKEMLAAIFSELGETLATRGNLNNHIGVPLTVLSVSRRHKAAVIEMGANHSGEIAYLTNIVKPTVAIINNAAAAHLEGFGSLEGVANAKGEIYQGLMLDGAAIINADDTFAPLWRGIVDRKHRIISFGLNSTADVSCRWQGDITGNQLWIKSPQGEFQCSIKLLGEHNVMNALAAVAAASGANVAIETLKAGLENLTAVPGRLQSKPGICGARIIDDTYNANPNSLRAGLDVLVACEGSKYLVLGDMGELGDDAEQLHQQAGEQARVLGVDRLFALGEFSRQAVIAFGDNAEHFESLQQLIDALRQALSGQEQHSELHQPKLQSKLRQQELSHEVTLLIKGSRMMHMEGVVDALTLGSSSETKYSTGDES